jgi:osmotically-inducible protein OsmY
MSNKYAIRLTLAAAVAGLLIGCENAARSTAKPSERLSVVRDAGAAEIRTGIARDALLVARLTDLLQGDPTTRELDIYVSVSEGRVRLSGFVDSAAAKLRAGALASETPGIESVENRLILRHSADIKDDPIGNARVYL